MPVLLIEAPPGIRPEKKKGKDAKDHRSGRRRIPHRGHADLPA
jgi:hypothetical protein